MAVDIILTRQSTFSINTGTDATPVWTPIGGLTSLSRDNPVTTAEGNTFDSGGWDKSLKSRMGLAFNIEAKYLVDAASGVRDPGQEAVELQNAQIGTNGLKKYQFKDGSTGGDVLTITGHVSGGFTGGGVDDNAGWSATIVANGAPVVT